MFWKYSIVFLFCSLIHFIIKINGAADCQSARLNCSQCFSTSYECFWCGDKEFGTIQNKRSRCDTYKNLQDVGCKSIIDDRSKSYELVLDKPFSNKTDDTIQLKPQRVKMSLRAGDELKVSIHFKRAEDYPMDLYYLVDLSCTMHKFKKILGDVGKKLADSLKSATSNFRIGFGSFVDKPVMPFSSFKIEPVTCQEETGEPPYSFSHKQSLTDNSASFETQVKRAKTSGNVDNPEGTLDALMQVLTCKEKIGWRNQSNKIIVVATDAEFHYAGDGKLAGIITPNDGECHMVNNIYTHFNVTDYPSMFQIAKKAQGFNIVFSVSDEVKPVYERLSKIIGTNSRVAALEAKDSEAVKLIKNTYDSIRSKVELTVKQKPDFVDIEFSSKCQTREWKMTSSCEYKDIKEITFNATIKLRFCPNNANTQNKIRIGLPNNENEVLEIDLKLLCECQCDSSSNVERNAVHCSNEGTLACGICRECYGKRLGHKCDCDPEQEFDPKDPDKYCRQQNSTSVYCSDRGNCECQKCDCKNGYQGSFCEIDKSGCYPNNDIRNKECNGNGHCDKGICDCNDRFSGTLCNCIKSNRSCLNNEIECSGQGKCECGTCICNEKTTKGTFCQICPSCEKMEYCNKSRDCVPQICETFYGSKDNCTQTCDGFSYKIVESNETLTDKFQCTFQTLDNQCGVEFFYERTDNENTGTKSFRITNATKNCKTQLNLVVVSGGVVSGTLLVGLALLLIWKLLTEIWDRKEYARFQKELSKVNWEQSENPLYKDAKSTFTNPMFNLRERAQKRLSRLTERFSRRFDVNNQ